MAKLKSKETLNEYFCRSLIGELVSIKSKNPRVITKVTPQGDNYFRLDFVKGEPEFVNFYATPVRVLSES